MSNESLSTVALDTINQYARTARYVVGTYRTGVHRVLDGLGGKFADSLGNERISLSEPIKKSLVVAEQELAGLIGGGVARLSSGADRAIDAAVDTASAGVQSVAGVADRIQRAFPSIAAQSLLRINMPALLLSREAAQRVADAAEKYSLRMVGERPSTPVAKAATRTRSVSKASGRTKRA